MDLRRSSFFVLLLIGWLASSGAAFPRPSSLEKTGIPSGGIKEEIPNGSKAKYARWKADLLSTRFGREQWEAYAGQSSFVLTIRVAGTRGKGAGTEFIWNEAGVMVGATITLGTELDQGYPPPTYYPVLNSLASASTAESRIGTILAASKMAHEISHVSQASRTEPGVLRTQERLVPVYVSIFLKNGLNPKDVRLMRLAEEIGGTPTEIWESREYWSEVDAMSYLRERIGAESYYCEVLDRIKMNVDFYAPDYSSRFFQKAHLVPATCNK